MLFSKIISSDAEEGFKQYFKEALQGSNPSSPKEGAKIVEACEQLGIIPYTRSQNYNGPKIEARLRITGFSLN